MRQPERAAEDGEVLRVEVDRAAVDGAPAGHDAVADGAVVFQAEARRLVAHEGADLDERAGVEQDLDALARAQLALFVLLREAGFAAAGAALGAAPVEVCESVLG